LIARLAQGDVAALSELYDRYAPLVFTLACGERPRQAEAITEDVFVDLWHISANAAPSFSIPSVLIDLTAQHLSAREAWPQQMTDHSAAPPVLQALASFAELPPAVFDVMVLARLGQLGVREIAIALALDQGVVVQRLATGFARLRARQMQQNQRRF
jgi:DNA-directed RNA polymerase specialized sigma24 family protein